MYMDPLGLAARKQLESQAQGFGVARTQVKGFSNPEGPTYTTIMELGSPKPNIGMVFWGPNSIVRVYGPSQRVLCTVMGDTSLRHNSNS